MHASMVASRSRTDLVDWYQRNRARSRALFDLLDPEVYYTRPIALRNPIVFYEGHLPAFSAISLLKRGLGLPGVDDRLESLFARGIDPESEQAAVPRSGADTRWPPRSEVLDFGRAVDDAIVEALERASFDLTGREHPAMAHGEAVFTALEHEAMHQETLLYMWRRLPCEHKRRPEDVRYATAGDPPRQASVEIPAGPATLGARRDRIMFGWDNEFDALVVDVPGFEIDAHSVTNADWLAFIADDGYGRADLWSDAGWEWRASEDVRHPAFWRRRGTEWFWRGMFEDLPLPLAWPVYVSQAEAAAYARWKGRRLPSEAEYHRAAYGTPRGDERTQPWDDAGRDVEGGVHGNFDFTHWEPVPAGFHPEGASAWGVHDLVGNGWEWTSTIFGPFPGFAAMASYPEYSIEFFDGQHFVLKGASPGTARELVRRSFRNWFRPNYPYVYAKFRTVAEAA
jgi:ergothioneine biosynthesis protein EgtB